MDEDLTTQDLGDTSPTNDCWRDVLGVRTVNAMLNHVLDGERTMRRFFAMSDHELGMINNLGPRGIERIRLAQRRVEGKPVAEWDADTLASMLVAFADNHPQRKVGDAMQEAANRLRLPRRGIRR